MRNLANRIGFCFFFSAVVVAVDVLLCGHSAVHGAIVLKFDDTTPGGTVTYDGVGGPLVGTNIHFDTILSDGTPLNDGVELVIENGFLNFTTGPNISEDPWDFAGGGTYTLTGTARKLDNTLVADGVLVENGSWTEASAVQSSGGLIVGGSGTDTKNQDLVDFFGIDLNSFVFFNTQISVGDVAFEPDGGFSGIVRNADLVNQAVPEPTSAVCWLMLALTVCACRCQGKFHA